MYFYNLERCTFFSCVLFFFGDHFVAGILAEIMSGKPGDLPKFVSDMMLKELGVEEPAEEVCPSRPKSETAQVTSCNQQSYDSRPKSDISRTAPAAQLLRQTDQKSNELREKETCKPPVSHLVPCEPETVPSVNQSSPASEKKPGTGSKNETQKPPPLMLSSETQRLIEDLQQQYSLPVFINTKPPQFYMDDAKEKARMSASANRPQLNFEQRKYVFPLLTCLFTYLFFFTCLSYDKAVGKVY